jgi:hypothetical protein
MRVFPYSQKPKRRVKFLERLVYMMNFFDWFMLTGDTTGNMTENAMKSVAKFDCENNPCYTSNKNPNYAKSGFSRNNLVISPEQNV